MNCNKILKLKNEARYLLRLATFILVDVRLIFIIMSVYITICTAITSAANNEAAADVNGNGTFDLTSRSEHNDLRISDVSNSVLWNCREKSITRKYYKILYGALSVAFAVILSMFILTRLSILWGNMRPGLDYLNKAMWHIQIIKKLRDYLEYKRGRTPTQYKNNKIFPHDQGNNISTLPEKLSDWSVNCKLKEMILDDTKSNKGLLCSMLIIPFMEAVFLIIALPFMLTTYDINPVGCLVGPDEDAIQYNNVTGRVELKIAKSVFVYQKAALAIFIVLMIGPIPFFAGFLLYKYIRITRGIAKNIEKKLKTHAV